MGEIREAGMPIKAYPVRGSLAETLRRPTSGSSAGTAIRNQLRELRLAALLLVPQGHNRIGIRRVPSRQVTRKRGYQGHQQN
jgi:hypothetical protein